MSSSGTNPKISIEKESGSQKPGLQKPGLQKPGLQKPGPSTGNAASFSKREGEARALGALSPEAPPGPHDTVKQSKQTWKPPDNDTVKLSHQTWKPPPEQDTVKLSHETWRPPGSGPILEPEDAITDIRSVPLPPAGSVSSGGEGDAEAAGEIGTDVEEPVRILDVPPDVLPAARERTPLPGAIPATRLAAEATPPPQTTTDRTPAVPIPKPAPAGRHRPDPTTNRLPRPMSPNGPLVASAVLQGGPVVNPPTGLTPSRTPAPRMPSPLPVSDASGPFLRNDESAPFARDDQLRHEDLTPFPHAGPDAPMGTAAGKRPGRRLEQTQMINIGTGPTKIIIATAVVASLLGLGTGYVLWGHPDRAPEPSVAPAAAVADVPSVEAVEAPKSIIAPEAAKPCVLKVTSRPPKSNVTFAGETLGVTPLEKELPCATGKAVRLEVSRKHFETSSREVTLDSDAHIEIDLARPVFEVTIVSEPPAELLVDGEAAGTTPQTVKLRGFVPTRLRLSAAGYRPLSTKLTPKKNASNASYRLKAPRRKRR